MENKTQKLIYFFIFTIVMIFFAHTLNYEWKHFDEQIIYNETYLPIPESFLQIIEYIKSFGLNYYFEASNPFYSSIYNIRNDPFSNIIILFVYWLFQKNFFAYHLFAMIFHAINTVILFKLLQKIASQYTKEKTSLICILLSLIWALHPTNLEAILLTTNWLAILYYFFCLSILYIFMGTLSNSSKIKSAVLAILFTIALFTAEHSITLLLILFAYGIFVQKSFTILAKKLFFPILIFTVYVLLFILSPTKENFNYSINESIVTTLERIFWLSPQIFVHYIKLILLPVHLSVDQTEMIHLADKILAPSAIFSSIFMFSLIIISLFRRSIYICFLPFFIALLPFLHILSPTYCLVSERYLYFPLAMLIFGFSHLIFKLQNQKMKKFIGVFLFAALILMGFQSYIRSLDWKNSISLYRSALNNSTTDLFKGLRQEFLGGLLISNPDTQKESMNYIINGLKTLEESLNKLEIKKIESKDKPPSIIKFYGLDPKTLQAKTAYLIALTKYGINHNINECIEIMRPHMKDGSIIDTQILDFYLSLLFASNNLDEAEILLKNAERKKLSSVILVILAELYKTKYNDFKTAEKYLLKAFKYFPYNVQTLNALQVLYQQTGDMKNYVEYSYLYGIRTHSQKNL